MRVAGRIGLRMYTNVAVLSGYKIETASQPHIRLFALNMWYRARSYLIFLAGLLTTGTKGMYTSVAGAEAQKPVVRQAHHFGGIP